MREREREKKGIVVNRQRYQGYFRKSETEQNQCKLEGCSIRYGHAKRDTSQSDGVVTRGDSEHKTDCPDVISGRSWTDLFLSRDATLRLQYRT